MEVEKEELQAALEEAEAALEQVDIMKKDRGIDEQKDRKTEQTNVKKTDRPKDRETNGGGEGRTLLWKRLRLLWNKYL